jgi:hypothetical protein
MTTSTTPETEVQSPEDRLASLLGGDEEPEQEADEANPEAEDSEAEQEASAEDEEQPEEGEEAEEVEFGGMAYSLPKPIAEVVKKADSLQADYTRKTQEAAEIRRAADERMRFLDRMEKVRSEQFESVVSLQSVQSQIKQLEAIDWNELARTDQSEFLRLDRMQRTLVEQRESLKETLRNAASTETAAVSEFKQEMLRRGAEELKRDIKGWSPERGKAIAENAKVYGFTDEELSELADARFVKALNDAYQWRQLQASKPGIEKKVSGARPMKTASRSAPQAQRDSQQVAARQALKKSGKSEDATAFFESMFSRK